MHENEHQHEHDHEHGQENEKQVYMENEQDANTQPASQPKKTGNVSSSNKKGYFISGITGGLIVAIIGLLLIYTNILPLQSLNSESQSADTQTGSESADSDNITLTANTSDDPEVESALEKSASAVVGVSNLQKTTANFWEQPDDTQEAGTGSGVIYKKENGKAYVVTNNHVIEGASEVEVYLQDGTTVSAKILGADELSDLAVLEIDGSKVDTVATLGSSNDLNVGETAIAIGNPLGMEFAGSVTKGIISGLERSVEIDSNKDGVADWTTEVIQTDAAINPGNSGGALVDGNGELIGINSMKIAESAVEGIGFAIPIDTAKPIIEKLETEGSVSRPFVGISAMDLATVPEQHKQETLQLPEDVEEGIVVAQVQSGSPAEQAGLKKYDVITQINDQTIGSMLDLKKYLYDETEVGDQVEVTYYRDGEKQNTSLTLSEQDEQTS
ncbi:S1C family serine protease [Sediminibacillus halophilus]|uniref:Serine protease Do n=1 Tax=Sediminibacillus halophilus TaxID=482461 RepID=A0A1G9WUD0_9BACI|nr:S1C family serine protease [Sediminibacillus halophilus]SDM88058.1 serine protease Do [Sediminibacillus halophilus]